MFDDILGKNILKSADTQLYICKYANKCDKDLCLHKHEHFKDELGRPEDDENKPNSDCSFVTCKEFKDAVCIPV